MTIPVPDPILGFAVVALVLAYGGVRSFAWTPRLPLSPQLLYFVIFFLMIGMGLFALSMDSTSAQRFRAPMAVVLGVAGVVGGMALVRWRRGDDRGRVEAYATMPPPADGSTNMRTIALWIVFTIGALIVMQYYYRWHLPMLERFMRPSSSVDGAVTDLLFQQRLRLTYRMLETTRWWRVLEMLRTGLLPFVFCLSLSTAALRGGWSAWFSAAAMALPTLLLAVGTGERGPATSLVLMAGIVYAYCRPFPIRWGTALAVIAATGACFVVLTSMVGRTDAGGAPTLRDSVQYAISRVVIGNAADNHLAFELFPETYRFEKGGTWWMSLSVALGRRSTGWSVEYLKRTYGRDDVGSSPTSSIVEGYINFGLAGSFFAGLLVGVLLQGLYEWLLSGMRTPLRCASFGFATYCLAFGFAIGGLFAPFAFGLAVVPFAWVGMKILFALVDRFATPRPV